MGYIIHIIHVMNHIFIFMFLLLGVSFSFQMPCPLKQTGPRKRGSVIISSLMNDQKEKQLPCEKLIQWRYVHLYVRMYVFMYGTLEYSSTWFLDCRENVHVIFFTLHQVFHYFVTHILAYIHNILCTFIIMIEAKESKDIACHFVNWNSQMRWKQNYSIPKKKK